MSRPHFLHVFPTFVAAGVQVRVARMIDAFGGRFRHSIVALDGRTDAMTLLSDGEDVEVVPPPSARGMQAIVALRRTIRAVSPDLLLTYNWGSFDAILANLGPTMPPHVHHEDGFNHDEATTQKLRRVLARRWLLPSSERVVVCSHQLLTIARDIWRLPKRLVTLIPNGIVDARFRGGDRDRTRARFDIPHHAFVIGAVGHLRPVKNFARLIETAVRLGKDKTGETPIHLLIVGDGELLDELTSLGVKNAPPGGRVHFVGHQSDLADFYAAMDLFALTSDSEQHPVALLEAMAAGLPAIATDVGDVRVVLPEEEQPFVIPLSGDPKVGLKGAIETLLNDAPTRTRLADANRQRVADVYSFEKMIDSYLDVYEGALSGRRS